MNSSEETPQMKALRAFNTNAKLSTRAAVFEALVNVGSRKRYDDITASDLIRESRVSRSSFYRHFPTKEAVLEDLMAQIIEGVDLNPRAVDSASAYWTVLLTSVYEHRRHIAIAFEAGAALRILDAMNTTNSDWEDPFCGAVFNGIIFNVIRTWVQEGFATPIHSMVAKAVQATKNIPGQPHEILAASQRRSNAQ